MFRLSTTCFHFGDYRRPREVQERWVNQEAPSWYSTMRLTSSLGCITAPTGTDAQCPMFRSPRGLRYSKHNSQPRKIRTVPVPFGYHRRFFMLITNGFSDRVETKHNCSSQNKTRRNERRERHGTMRKCRVGDEGMTTLCSSSSCSLCCIIKSSFSISFFSKRTGWGRSGVGIHTTAISSKFVQYLSSTLG